MTRSWRWSLKIKICWRKLRRTVEVLRIKVERQGIVIESSTSPSVLPLGPILFLNRDWCTNKLGERVEGFSFETHSPWLQLGWWKTMMTWLWFLSPRKRLPETGISELLVRATRMSLHQPVQWHPQHLRLLQQHQVLHHQWLPSFLSPSCQRSTGQVINTLKSVDVIGAIYSMEMLNGMMQSSWRNWKRSGEQKPKNFLVSRCSSMQ